DRHIHPIKPAEFVVAGDPTGPAVLLDERLDGGLILVGERRTKRGDLHRVGVEDDTVAVKNRAGVALHERLNQRWVRGHQTASEMLAKLKSFTTIGGTTMTRPPRVT